uniref:Carbonyl reductase n=1 Tax=Panagrolaimus sp. PS1159 TaxID=55785 RepID=A0AC35FAR9_9BILA
MSQQIFVVTGANKGIGYGIVETLASTVNNAIIYLTARDESRGKSAVQKLEQELGNKKKSEIRFHQLDIEDEASAKRFAEYLKKTHGEIDVLINNAGFAFKQDATESAEEQANVTIGINYYGTKKVSTQLVPLIKKGGRIVNVCSQAGVMIDMSKDKEMEKFKIMKDIYDEKHIQKLKNASSEKEIDEFVEEYKKAAKDDTRKEHGFPCSAYRVSKAAEIAYTLLLHRQHKDLVVNACCPGYVNTDMSSGKGPLTIEQGADTPVYLATDSNAPNGDFVYQRKSIPWC